GPGRPAPPARRRPGSAAGGAAADVRAARGRRAELPRGGPGAGDLDRHGDEPAVLRPPQAPRLPRPSVEPMSPSPEDPDRPPPELRAGYAAGELPARQRSRGAQWRAGDPAAAGELEWQRDLSPRRRRFWRAAAPPDPGPTKWAGVLANIEAALAPRSQAAGPAPPSLLSPRPLGRVAAP